ncbi:MAG: twin-arginine translocase TatA/TatE family subunit [Bacteroidota bacterium]|nr:twin-arginine translocase TatA/TatE family subunit [Bacteroidota bacterium]
MTINTLLFFNIGAGELFVVITILFLIFGPKKMPEIARKIGKTINYIKHATNDITTEITKETDKYKDIIDEQTKPIKDQYNKAKKDIDRETKKSQNEFTINGEENKKTSENKFDLKEE